MRFTISTRNAGAVAANFYAADLRCQVAVRRIVKRYAKRTYALTYALTPEDTGRMKRLLKMRISPSGFVYEVGWEEDDFTAEGQPFYVLYVLFGTVKMAARDVLFAPNESNRHGFQVDLAIELRRAARRAARAA